MNTSNDIVVDNLEFLRNWGYRNSGDLETVTAERVNAGGGNDDAAFTTYCSALGKNYLDPGLVDLNIQAANGNPHITEGGTGQFRNTTIGQWFLEGVESSKTPTGQTVWRISSSRGRINALIRSAVDNVSIIMNPKLRNGIHLGDQITLKPSSVPSGLQQFWSRMWQGVSIGAVLPLGVIVNKILSMKMNPFTQSQFTSIFDGATSDHFNYINKLLLGVCSGVTSWLRYDVELVVSLRDYYDRVFSLCTEQSIAGKKTDNALGAEGWFIDVYSPPTDQLIDPFLNTPISHNYLITNDQITQQGLMFTRTITMRGGWWSSAIYKDVSE